MMGLAKAIHFDEYLRKKFQKEIIDVFYKDHYRIVDFYWIPHQEHWYIRYVEGIIKSQTFRGYEMSHRQLLDHYKGSYDVKGIERIKALKNLESL